MWSKPLTVWIPWIVWWEPLPRLYLDEKAACQPNAREDCSRHERSDTLAPDPHDDVVE
jgi:hypothetical protein